MLATIGVIVMIGIIISMFSGDSNIISDLVFGVIRIAIVLAIFVAVISFVGSLFAYILSFLMPIIIVVVAGYILFKIFN